MSLRLEKFQKFLAYFLGCHHNNKQYLKYNPAKILLFWEKTSLFFFDLSDFTFNFFANCLAYRSRHIGRDWFADIDNKHNLKVRLKVRKPRMTKYQIDMYAAGLHRRGSKAVERYTNMEIRDDFALRNIAFRQKAYKVDKDLNVVEELRIFAEI